MYFPYLYGKRFELLALRDAVAELSLASKVVPVIEPVSNNSREIKTCLQALGSASANAVVVLNPQNGLYRQTPPTELIAALAEDFEQHPSLLPGFVCRPQTRAREANRFLASYPSREVAILYWAPQLTDDELRDLTGHARIRFHINVHDQMAAAQRSILPPGKAVDIRDRFNALTRNADYEGVEFFTDSHLTFRQNAVGFGDYSVIGSTYRDKGGPAHAVAIHAVYRHPATRQIWVEHFVSDDTEQEVGTVAEKFHQAATKLVRTATRRRSEFGQDAALSAYSSNVRDDYFPGLGENKRREILHHIALNHRLLTDLE
jgi:hypothetical protein